ncbi:putative dynein heavy chain 3, axonemal [Penaeus vannamei]|uniref:Putative dynein heavy chain 3, axonemal n=1 Tax=Penaeus vannamei TaxID=6689 RepID=A0A3R7PSU8_PENVA|nr:putative dynein heavy chain 3, axonemal [Penaeus vannamei]
MKYSENKEAQQAGDAQEGEGEEEGQEDAKDASQEDEEEDDVIYQVIPRQADEGMYTWGFFLEGARWDREQRCLVDMVAKQLHDQLPIILFQPAPMPEEEGGPAAAEEEVPGMYRCPVYRTSDRSGTISTTGHSSNYILDLILPSQLPQSYWVARGAAALTQLDD